MGNGFTKHYKDPLLDFVPHSKGENHKRGKRVLVIPLA
jgi:hypothetical protein